MRPPTVIVTDNNTAVGIANDTIKQKQSKAMDMRFYWIRDRTRQGQFHIIWKSGKLNKANYFTKHFPGKFHQEIRSSYLHVPTATSNYYDCLVDNSVPPKTPKNTKYQTKTHICASLPATKTLSRPR